MRLCCLILSTTTLAGICPAQNDSNPVRRNNDPWVVTSVATHPTTGRAYPWPPYNPPEYSNQSSTTGVPANTLSWRWIPSETNLRHEARSVSGFEIGLAPSAATTSYPQTGYIPEIKIHKPKAQGTGSDWWSGRRYEPDLAQQAHLTHAQSSIAFPQHAWYVVTTALATPVAVTEREIVLSAKWVGGEQLNKPNTQALWGGFEGIHAPLTMGFATPAGVISLTTTDQSVLYFSYFEEQAVINPSGDWSYRRNAQPNWTGTGVTAAFCDLATNAGKLGWNVDAGPSQAGNLAFAFMNVGPVMPIGIPIGPLTFELNLSDPNLLWLSGFGYSLTLNVNGAATGPVLNVPALGSGAVGATIGVEFVLITPNFTFTESTQSAWMRIVR